MTHICSECGRPIQHGSEAAYTDNEGNLFCNSMCANDYHGIDSVDWDDYEDDDNHEPLETRENFFGAHLIKDGIVTNGHYAIIGVDTPNQYDDGADQKRLVSYIKRMAEEHESREKRLVNLAECSRRVQRGVNLIDIGGITVQQRYLDLVVELLALQDQILVGVGNDTISVKTDDGKFAIIAAWVD